MQAELIAVGSELLWYGRPDRNGDWLAEQLLRAGVPLRGRHLVEDDPDAIGAVVREALGRGGLVIVSGGLGPTEDDRTREGLARALEVELERDRAMLRELRGRFAAKGWRFSETHARMAERPAGAGWLDNPIGGAPGIVWRDRRRWLVALPGVPAELQAMYTAHVAPALGEAAGPQVLLRRRFRMAGLSESVVDSRLQELSLPSDVGVTVLAGAGLVDVLLLVREGEPARARQRLAALGEKLAAAFGEHLYGVDEETLARAVGRLLSERSWRLATAESCTGGLLGAVLTEVPGASRWYRGGWVLYADELKERLAGVDANLLREAGAVSAPVAECLACEARARLEADVGVGITGIAGPTGGSPAKPVGLVYVAVADAAGIETHEHRFSGDRAAVRERAVHAALDGLRRRMQRSP